MQPTINTTLLEVGKVKGWRLQPTAVFNDPTIMAEKMDTGEEGGDKGNLDYFCFVG